MTSSAFRRPAFIVDALYELAVDAAAPLFKLRSTRSPAGVTAQTEVTFAGRLRYTEHGNVSEPVSLTLCSILPADPDNDPFPLGMLYIEAAAGDAALYVSQSEPIITHLVATSRAGQILPFELICRAGGHDRLEIIEFTCEHS